MTKLSVLMDNKTHRMLKWLARRYDGNESIVLREAVRRYSEGQLAPDEKRVRGIRRRKLMR